MNGGHSDTSTYTINIFLFPLAFPSLFSAPLISISRSNTRFACGRGAEAPEAPIQFIIDTKNVNTSDFPTLEMAGARSHLNAKESRRHEVGIET